MVRGPIPTHCFSLVVVRLGHRILVVHERKHGQQWYLPAGAVELHETFEEAAVRETREEAGLKVYLDGILRVERTVMSGEARLRVIFSARPVDDRGPKTVPDRESLEARFVTIAEMRELPLRSDEVLGWGQYVLGGGTVFPLSLLTTEAARLL